jgi:hypothetical protein
LHSFKIGFDDEGLDIVSAFVDPKPNQKKKSVPESLTAFNNALDETLQQSGADRTTPGKGTGRTVRLAEVRASFARHYRPKGAAVWTANDRPLQWR